MDRKNSRCFFIILIMFFWIGQLYSQGVPHSFVFHIFHADGITPHLSDNFGFKVINTQTGSSATNGPCYFNYDGEEDTSGIASYDDTSGALIVYVSNFFSNCDSGEEFTFEFVGDYESELEFQLIRGVTSVTNGGNVEFGSLLMPSDVQIVKNEDNISISWASVAGADKYRVERSTSPFFESIDSFETDENIFIDAISENKKFYRIIAIEL